MRQMMKEHPLKNELVKQNTELKKWLVSYTGIKKDPEDEKVTVEMIIDTMVEEFPELVLVLAEENYVRGYQQALDDIEALNKKKNVKTD